MKRIHLHLIIYMAILLGLPSCEHEIPYNPEMKQPCLVMNALLEAGDDQKNEVSLYLSTGDNLGKLNDDATLSLYINGHLAAAPQEADPKKLFLPPEYLQKTSATRNTISTRPSVPATSFVWKQRPKAVLFGPRQKYRFLSLPWISAWIPVPSRSTWAAASSLPTVATL